MPRVVEMRMQISVESEGGKRKTTALGSVELINTSSRPINHPSIHRLPPLLLPARSSVPGSLELVAAIGGGLQPGQVL